MPRGVYYNEIDPYCVAWLRNLITAGHLPAGDVDDRDIREVKADDVKGYDQCHFFAGIGGWACALQLAEWGEAPVWTGSCPCQPFSGAGKRKGFADERHLWPDWFKLIAECRPAIVFGEQVAGAIKHGWLDAVFADLEGQGYACGAAVLPACGVGAPHIRQRVWFVADAERRTTERWRHDLATAPSNVESETRERQWIRDDARPSSVARGLEHATREQVGLSGRARLARSTPWAAIDWLPCTDGKARPVEPGTFPLAHGLPGRVGRLRAYGNAIVPQVAEAFIRSVGND